MKRWILYRHTSPSGKVYVGITSKSVNKRWNGDRGYKTCIYFYNAILKYGWDNIKHEILFTDLEEKRAKSLEIELIRHYKSLGISYKSQEFRDKISKAVDYKKSKVSQFTLEGEYLRSFSSANEAEKFTSVSRGAILRCCKGKVKRAGNFIWRYYGKGI